MSNVRNCFNPGYDLMFAKPDCTKSCEKNYDPNCMYNTQGKYVCSKDKNELFNSSNIAFISNYR
jgi:hypothetical protein